MAKKKRPTAQAASISQRLAESMGFEHLETVFDKEAAGTYLRVHLDKPGGISLDDCEAYHRALQPLVEQLDYDFLEVCSAGIDRPIKTERDARKALGEQVEIKLFRPRDGRKEFSGVLTGFDENGFHLQADGEQLVFEQKDVALARRTVDLSILDEEDVPPEEEKE
ncbi:MAG: ribosome maturation factor RimP [Clostridiales bacterium]|nr:ribosome maturation factor RimP [Clostridiales bacterium]